MNKKIVTLLKMTILSLGLIAMFAMVERDKGSKVEQGKTVGTTSYYFAMGTSISINIYDKDKAFDEAGLTEQIVKEIKFIDEELLSWRSPDSELGKLNNSREVSNPISTELYTVLAQSLAICRDSDGALDITIRPLVALWNIEGDGNITDGEEAGFAPPSSEEIETVLQKVDYQSISLVSGTYSTISSAESDQTLAVENNYYIDKASEDIIIDLGATGKGYALDQTMAILNEAGTDGALITVGGSILVYGEKSDGSSWRIGVRDPNKPEDTSAMMGYLEFPAGTTTCISTSGGYEKFKTFEGKEYHHILDSNTGYPSESGLLSVTVVCDNGLVSDGLSTACFVLGYEKSLPVLEKYNAQAVFMDRNGDIMVTEGLKDCWIKQ